MIDLLIKLFTGWLARLVSKLLIAYCAYDAAKAQTAGNSTADAVGVVLILAVEAVQSYLSHKQTAQAAVSSSAQPVPVTSPARAQTTVGGA